MRPRLTLPLPGAGRRHEDRLSLCCGQQGPRPHVHPQRLGLLPQQHPRFGVFLTWLLETTIPTTKSNTIASELLFQRVVGGPPVPQPWALTLRHSTVSVSLELGSSTAVSGAGHGPQAPRWESLLSVPSGVPRCRPGLVAFPLSGPGLPGHSQCQPCGGCPGPRKFPKIQFLSDLPSVQANPWLAGMASLSTPPWAPGTHP